MVKKRDTDAGWSWTLSPAIPNDDGSVTAMFFGTDDEFLETRVSLHKPAAAKEKVLLKLKEYGHDLNISPDGTIYLASEGGAVHVCKDGNWSKIKLPTKGNISSIWAYNDNEIYASMDSSILKYSKGKWTFVARDLENDIHCIYGDGENFFAVGYQGVFYHSTDGQKWKAEETGVKNSLQALCMTEDGTVFAVGTQGCLVYGTKGKWHVLKLEGAGDLQAVANFKGKIYVGSEEGLYTYDGKMLSSVKADLDVVSIRTSDKYMCIAGEHAFHLFDGMKWQTTKYTIA